jgi:predicted SAM-dependent methyltransferase
MKINLGCGKNLLEGWSNHDSDVDITKPLPWDNGVANFIFAEHVVEHITYWEAIEFFRECRRILRDGGVCRIAVPSVVQIWQTANAAYCEFTTKWVKNEKDPLRRAMTNVLLRHGHKAPWTRDLLEATLFYVGFYKTQPQHPGCSGHQELRGIEGHDRIIGKEFNAIETVVVEATK